MRIAQMHAVQTIAEEITRELDLSTLLTLIVNRAADLLEAARSILYLWDEGTHTLHPRAWYNAGEWLSSLPLRLGEGVAGTVAQRREGRIINAYQQSPYAHPTFIAHFGSAPLMAESLLYRDWLMGVLVAALAESGPGFTAQDRALLAVFAAQATIAIEKARLFEESTQRHAWLTQILAINKRLATSTDMPSLLSRIAEEAARLVGVEGATLRIRHGDALVTTHQTQYGLVLPHLPALRLGEGIAGVAARDDRIMVMPDLQTHPDIPAFMKAQAADVGLHAMVSLPIQGRHSVLGVLSVHEAVTLAGGQLVARGVQVHLTPHLPVVRGDRPRLLAVLQNLVDHALRFMRTRPAPRIEIETRQEGEQTICYVQDNGVGIEPRHHEKVFGLFERLEATSGGTGMGLALVKRILEGHGGRIWVESAGQGHGSTFCFTLPHRSEHSRRAGTGGAKGGSVSPRGRGARHLR